MNITLSGTKVSMDGHTLAFQKNNLVDSMVITVDTDETWQYKLDVKYPCKDSDGKELYNVIDLTRVGNTCTAILQAPMLPFNGKYTMQLRGISGNKVYHTDTFDVWVKYSIDPSKVYDPVPSEFYQIEQAVTEQAANAKQSASNAAESAAKAEDAAVHSPIIGENGNWFVWDFTKSEYVDTGKPSSTPPITPETAGKYLTNDGSKAEWGVPSGGSDLSLGITSAQVGQIAKITAVDTDGKPTAWEPVDMPSGGGGETWEKIAEIELRADTAEYVLADFATWSKAKVIMTRSKFISGLKKNVWVVVRIQNVGDYNCGYLTSGYGYVYWEFSAEVNEMFITSTALENNNPNAANYMKSSYTLTPLNASPSDCAFVLKFTDTSVIQEGDKVTVIGVRR